VSGAPDFAARAVGEEAALHAPRASEIDAGNLPLGIPDGETAAADTYSRGASVLRVVGLPPVTFTYDSEAAALDLPTLEMSDASDSPIDSPEAPAAGEVPCAGDGHEMWIVSTRDLAGGECGCTAADFFPRVERFICGSGWESSTLQEFLATDDSSRVTAVLVHGNDTDAAEAEARGRQLYCQLRSRRCVAPTRLVIWSWPSEKVMPQFRKDAQLKACRTNIEGYYLARFIDRLPAETPVNLAGYSYGARVVTGGLHLLGGGALAGRQLDDREHASRPAANAILLGAAMANNWLLPGMRHDRALSQVDRMLILFNPADLVLHWYPRLWGRGGPEALGATGLVGASRLGSDRGKVRQVNVRPQLHHRHGWEYVSSSPAIMSLLWRELAKKEK